MGAIILLLNILMDYCYYRTNLDTKNMVDPTWKYVPKKIWDLQINIVPLTEDFVSYLESFGLSISSTLLFYTNISYNYAHVDLLDSGEMANPALNYVIDGRHSKMNWYNYPKEVPPPSLTPAGTLYHNYELKDLELIDSYEITTNELTLVRVDIPHAIAVKREPRICISIRLKPKKHLNWDVVVEEFKAKNLLLPR